MGQVYQSIIRVFAHCFVSREVAVVNPHIGRFLDCDAITVCGENFGDLHVPDDHVLLAEDGETNSS